MFAWLIQPQSQKAPARRVRQRRAAERMLPSSSLLVGGSVRPDPFGLYPCTRMHGADFEAEFNAVAGDLQHI